METRGLLDSPEIVRSIAFVVSGLFFSKVSACSLIINDFAEARLGGRMRQSLLKQNLAP